MKDWRQNNLNIGCYDIDLFHSSIKYPNFSLMKIYNYHYHNNDRVTMVRPADKDLGRFTNLIYFKDQVNKNFPNEQLNSKENKIITYGYGFYKQEIPLIEKYRDVPPDLAPYDLFYDKFTASTFERFKKSSFVHVGFKDLSGFNENFKNIYVVDNEIEKVKWADDFFHEYHNYNFYFYHIPKAHSIEEYERLEKFENLFQQKIKVNFLYDKNFVLTYKNNPYYPLSQIENETLEQREIRIIKTGLLLKSIGLKGNFPPHHVTPIVDKFLIYCRDGAAAGQSFAEYFRGNKEVEKLLAQQTSNKRLLLKTKPKSELIDF